MVAVHVSKHAGVVLTDHYWHVICGHVSVHAGEVACGIVLVSVGAALEGRIVVIVYGIELVVGLHRQHDWVEHGEGGGLESRRHDQRGVHVLGVLLLEPVSVVVEVFVAGGSQGLWGSVGLIIPLD